MSDETIKLSAKSWARTVDSINKVGYSDGIVDGQAASFQSSFDLGYKQGFEFGFQLGLKRVTIHQSQEMSEFLFNDPRRINCQICLMDSMDTNNDNIVNLYNRQHEKNNEYLKQLLNK